MEQRGGPSFLEAGCVLNASAESWITAPDQLSSVRGRLAETPSSTTSRRRRSRGDCGYQRGAVSDREDGLHHWPDQGESRAWLQQHHKPQDADDLLHLLPRATSSGREFNSDELQQLRARLRRTDRETVGSLQRRHEPTVLRQLRQRHPQHLPRLKDTSQLWRRTPPSPSIQDRRHLYYGTAFAPYENAASEETSSQLNSRNWASSSSGRSRRPS